MEGNKYSINKNWLYWRSLADYSLLTLTRQLKVTWEQATSPLLVVDPLTAAMHNRSTVFVMWCQWAHPSNTRLPGSTQLSSHYSNWDLIGSLVFAGLMPNCLLHCMLSPSNTLFLWPTEPTTPNRIVIQSCCFSEMWLKLTGKQCQVDFSGRIQTEPMANVLCI